jgi:hypothetical protein
MSRFRPAIVTSHNHRFRYSAVELLGALVLLLVVTPFVQSLRNGQLMETVAVSLVLVSAVFAVGGRGRVLWSGAVLCSIALLARWTQHFSPDFLPAWVTPITALTFLIFVVVNMIRFIIRPGAVTTEIICASIATYLLLGLTWAMVYVLLARESPDAFSFPIGPEAERTMDNFNAFYFSFVVLSTVGFGDIVPISRAARMIAVLEAVTGMFYITILVARLVALYGSAPRRADEERDPH